MFCVFTFFGRLSSSARNPTVPVVTAPVKHTTHAQNHLNSAISDDGFVLCATCLRGFLVQAIDPRLFIWPVAS